MRKTILPAVGIAALAVTLVGCGSSGKSTVGLSSPPLAGNDTGSAIPEFDQDGALNLKCATWVSNTPQNSDYPQLRMPTTPVDGHQLLMIWKVPAGAGTSDIAKHAGNNNLSVDGQGFQDVAVDVNNATASSGSVQINPAGSGSLSFKDLANESGKISGTITWTCVDSK